MNGSAMDGMLVLREAIIIDSFEFETMGIDYLPKRRQKKPFWG